MINVTPETTYAIVVGVEKYEAGSTWKLDGPANDARRFADWLSSRQVPEKNIYRFLSPIDENKTLVKPGVQAATHENIYRTLTTLLPKIPDGTLLYFFWSGHGIITPDNRRLLFYADATQENTLNLDINSMLTLLRSDYFPGLEQQIYLIDACANYVGDWQVYGKMPTETFPLGEPTTTHEQFVLLAAKPGERATNVTKQQVGLFSQALMDDLIQTTHDQWPPAMEALAERLAERFSKLREQGLAKQTPTHFWYRNWKGGERLFSDMQTTVAKVRNVLVALTPQQRRQLVDLLMACPSMRNDDSREVLLHELRNEIFCALRRNHQSARFDITLIVETCSNYSGGLHELIEVVQYFEGDSIPMRQLETFISQIPLGL